MLWTDTLLLGYFKTPVEVGIYSAAMPTAQLLFIFPNALMVIFLPVISGMQDFKSPEFATVFRIVTKWIFLVNIIPLALFIIYPRQILSIVFGNAYSSGDASLVILSMGFFISHLALSSNNVLLALGKTKLVFMNNFIGSIANLVLNILLIPKYGIIGASVATSFSFVLMSLLMFAESWHFTKIMPFNLNILKSVFSIIISLLLVNYLVGRYSISNISSIILASVLLLLLYAIFLFVTKALEKEDYYILNNIYKKMGIKIGIIDDFFSRME
ncbi:polysaccharide biosynthesis C-terminal domain-containing protein [Candidatus Woesearchaeota archaeon]|nr:polysaccharide biosynthesis C-terminal domain-containing protein [Candidatus Woesearchaeota archaeon]